MGNDTLANMITSIRNANLRQTKTVEILATNTNRSIAKILLNEGFIEELRERQQDIKRVLVITLNIMEENENLLLLL